MKRVNGYFKDSIKITAIASMVSLVLSLVISFIGLLMYGVDIIKILEGIRMALFIVGSFGLFLWALFAIKKKNKELLKHETEWKDKFKELKFATVMLMFSGIILLYGIVVDYVLYNIS